MPHPSGPLAPRPLAVVAEIAALLLAACCSGCDLPGALLCEGCRAALRPDPRGLTTPGGLGVRAAMPFEGVAARCIRRLKGEGETLLARPLGAALAAVLDEATVLGAVPVPVPTGRAAFRRRGYRVPELLLRHAGAVPLRVLRSFGTPIDQRSLGAERRAENVRGSMRARRRGRGERVVLVDDVVTTGATLDEARRALGAAGFEVVSAVALTATPRRVPLIDDSSALHRRHGGNDP